MSDRPASRRELLRRGAIVAGTVAAAGTLRPALAGAQVADDEDLRDFLVEAIGLEQVTVLAYANAADAAAGGDRGQLEDFRDQEQAHANALRSAIDEIGFDPPEAPDSPTDTGVFDDVEGLDAEQADRLKARLAEIDGARSPDDFRRLLSSLEDEQIKLYVGDGAGLDSADLATTAVEIAGCAAQHLVVLLMQAGRSPAEAATAVAEVAADAPGVTGELEPRAVSNSRSELIRWAGVQDANTAGFVHGGMVMKTCDEAAAIAAIRHCGRRVVTAGMDRMTFTEPVHVGELITCLASVNAAWRTSMEIGVRVEAEDARSGEVRHTSTAYVTMVALDDEGRPAPVPGVIAESTDEQRREREAGLRRANRLSERDQIIDDRG